MAVKRAKTETLIPLDSALVDRISTGIWRLQRIHTIIRNRHRNTAARADDHLGPARARRDQASQICRAILRHKAHRASVYGRYEGELRAFVEAVQKIE